MHWFLSLPDPPTTGGDSWFAYAVGGVVVAILWFLFRRPRSGGKR